MNKYWACGHWQVCLHIKERILILLVASISIYIPIFSEEKWGDYK